MLNHIAPPKRTPPAQVLIVEDARFDRQRLARLCGRIGAPLQLTEAPTLARAADLIEQQAFDLVLLDQTLPDGTGLDALDMLRLSGRNCTASTIMITGQESDALRADALHKGCSGFITKDTLTLPAFRTLVLGILETAQEPGSVVSPCPEGVKLDDLMRRQSADCARQIKPMVSRMMRQLRSMRSAHSSGAAGGLLRVDELEETCKDLWQYLITLEADHHADLGERSSAADASTPPRKPSLFSKV